MSASLGARDGAGRVAVPLPEEEPSRPSLVPEDVWRSYQQELAKDEGEGDASSDELALLQDSEFDEIPSEAFKATISADVEVAMLALAKVPLFAPLDRGALERLARAARQGEVQGGEYLFLEGQAADSFYVVLDGALEVLRRRDGREMALRQMGTGEATGVFGLFSGQARAASARALGEAVVLEVPGEALNALIGKDAGLRERVLRLYEERLLETFLSSSKLFADVDPSARARLIPRFVRRRLKTGEALVQPGEVCNLFAVLVTGHLLLESRPKGSAAEARTFQLDSSEFLAVTSAFSGAPSRIRVWAGEESTLVLLGQRELAELVKDCPALRLLNTRLPQHARTLDRDVYCGHTSEPGL
jgi:cAMP-dependent protein kinase regulator